MKTKIWIVLAPYCGTKHKDQTHIILAEGDTAEGALTNAFGANMNDAPMNVQDRRRSFLKEVKLDEASNYLRVVVA